MPSLLLTGMQRSGTTLLDKLLCNHPRISLLSQPLPLLFVEVKRRFLKHLGEDAVRYPVGDLFLESRYRGPDLHRFLADHSLDHRDLQKVFSEMAGFSGQYTKPAPELVEGALERLEPGDLAAVLAQLYRRLAHNPGADWFGAKETLWEELLPFVLDRGFFGLIILRDPRGVLASLNYGRGPEYGGMLKPTLFNLRNWRKSVAFALHLADHPGFLSLRYEDLVARPLESLDRIAARLGIEPFAPELFRDGIRDQRGQRWEGNSSHQALGRIEPEAVDSHREILPAEVARYVEATCWPELRCLGYPLALEWSEAADVIRRFTDPYPVSRPELSGHAADPSRAVEELRRRELLERGGEGEIGRFFLFADVFGRLAETVPA